MVRKKNELRALWRANLKVGNKADSFYFRSTDEFTDASMTAQELLEASPACQIAGAVIVGIERVAKLWN